MQVKITPALVAAAALLPSALANLQCSMQSFKANIINVEVESASDFSNKVHESKDWADVSLTEKYNESVGDALHHITMRHYGSDCRLTPTAKSNICNEGYVEQKQGNSCAQVTHKSHRFGFGTGKAVDISGSASESAVVFSASLAPSLLTWKAGIPGTCANQVFSAPDKAMKVLTFSASNMHRWNSVVVTLDDVDYNFGQGWLCQYSETLSSNRPAVSSLDGKTFKITNVTFDPILRDNDMS